MNSSWISFSDISGLTVEEFDSSDHRIGRCEVSLQKLNLAQLLHRVGTSCGPYHCSQNGVTPFK